MPTYEYHCDSCAENFDVVQSFTDEPLTSCPTCGSAVRKVFGSVGIVFKGSGFYKTDSRSSNGKKADPSGTPTDGSSKADSGSGSSTTTSDGDQKASSAGGDSKKGGESTKGEAKPKAPASPVTSD